MSLNPGVPFSVETWAKVAGGSGALRAVVSSRGPGTSSNGFVIYAGAKDRWELWLGSGAKQWNTLTGSRVTLGRWTHLVATVEPSGRGEVARLYVNGQLAAEHKFSAFGPPAAGPLRLGAGDADGVAAEFLPGSLDEVAVYGKALSAGQVSAHYARATGR